VPLIYIPLESIASKWYGESEKTLSSMLNLAEQMGGCIIFLDEVRCHDSTLHGDVSVPDQVVRS
jgi:SpoVK/Ycf46/Vps4 family AAA+-type ATPase